MKTRKYGINRPKPLNELPDDNLRHTPTPWHRNVSPAWKYPIYASATGNDEAKDWIHIAAVLPGNPNNEADLDFILRAVNSHEELVGLLKDCLSTWGEEMKVPFRVAIKEAITKAEKGE